MLRSNAHKSVMLNSMEDQDALQPEDHPSPLPSGNAALVDHPPAPPPSSSNGGRGTSSLAHMEKMRQEIRQLQEKRAAAMMNEVVELQRERDTAVGRVKIMKQTLEDFSMENAVLKETIGRGDQVQRLFHLEKTLHEEQLYSSDLKKKLQTANRQIAMLRAKVKDLGKQRASEGGPPSGASLLGVAEEEDSILERSRSLNDMETEFERKEEQKGGSPPTHYHLPRLNLPKQQRESPKVARLEVSTPSTPLTNNYSPSPTVIPRRYKLAAVQCRAVGTQVDIVQASSNDKTVSPPESALQSEVEVLRKEKKALEDAISDVTARREEDKAKHREEKIEIEQLKTECDVLGNSLSEFSRWVRQKMQLVEEDIDVCRVIYSLHGSLSQEAALLRELQDRLGHSEQKIAELTSENRQLRETVKYTDDKYKQMKKLSELQKEKLVLLTPTKSSKQTFYWPSPLTSSPQTSHRSSPLPHTTSSPLLKHTTASPGWGSPAGSRGAAWGHSRGPLHKQGSDELEDSNELLEDSNVV